MARKHDVKAVRAAIAALDRLGENGPEIHRRLRNDQCDLGYPVDISLRNVYYHLDRMRKEERKAEIARDNVPESVSAAKEKVVELLTRELLAHEAKKPGTLGKYEVAAVERIYTALGNIEKAEQSKGRSKPQTNGKPDNEPESAIQRLAKESGPSSGGAEAAGLSTNPPPSLSPPGKEKAPLNGEALSNVNPA